ncbi:DNA-directed RNA polymerase III subunit RPC7-like [Frankliniella fusca]|uniref:DNA-directed RNA polymerase III subunit RPC7-like n=1 Tax=Frankliniella fusca TaxID=407009 RepID=A0AAE1LJY5_9NEOP|nr:DNA-directed RNA polymerase III subunit RPC7-like [Frankliniella fusca]
MAGRGRGRGGGSSFNREISERMGMAPGSSETPVESVLEPPPLFPPLENRPVPLELGVEGEYLLALKRDFVGYFRDSPSFIQNVVVKSDNIQRYSDRYQNATLALKTITDVVRDWSHFPNELRGSVQLQKKKRKLKGSTGRAKVPKKSEDITTRLEELEKREEQGSDADGETEGQDTEGAKDENKENKDADSDAEEAEEEDVDEEMDDGTDYINSYFDNGEEYLDEEDDNLEDGPVY